MAVPGCAVTLVCELPGAKQLRSSSIAQLLEWPQNRAVMGVGGLSDVWWGPVIV
jgi:hypothetical protein